MCLIATLAVIAWTVLVIWGLWTPRHERDAHASGPLRHTEPQLPSRVFSDYDEELPAIAVFSTAPTPTAPPVADNVVILAEWREEQARKAG